MTRFPGNGLTADQRDGLLCDHAEAAVAKLIGELILRGDSVERITLEIKVDAGNRYSGTNHHSRTVDYARDGHK